MSGPCGVLPVDKPAGPTSHDVVAEVRRVLGARPGRRGRRKGPKVGHAGTLDPPATGLLVVCVGPATRLVPYLQGGRKTYHAEMVLGEATDTLDAAGEVTARADASAVAERDVCDALRGLVGTIEQVPPMVSAVRVGGERLHQRARRGEEVERAAREVTVHDLVLEDFEPGRAARATFLVTCSAGTYVRSLAADLGAALGLPARLDGLRRLASGALSVEQAVDLDRVRAVAGPDDLAALLVEPAEALAHLPRRELDDDEARSVAHGGRLEPTGVDGPVAAVHRGALVAVVDDDERGARPRVVLAGADGQGGGR